MFVNCWSVYEDISDGHMCDVFSFFFHSFKHSKHSHAYINRHQKMYSNAYLLNGLLDVNPLLSQVTDSHAGALSD